MPANLKGLEFQTDEGKWRVDYIGDPDESVDSGRVEYYLRFKWVDPHDGQNLETPERRLKLLLFKEDMISDDSELKLVRAVAQWIGNSDPEVEARFDYAYPHLKPHN